MKLCHGKNYVDVIAVLGHQCTAYNDIANEHFVWSAYMVWEIHLTPIGAKVLK